MRNHSAYDGTSHRSNLESRSITSEADVLNVDEYGSVTYPSLQSSISELLLPGFVLHLPHRSPGAAASTHLRTLRSLRLAVRLRRARACHPPTRLECIQKVPPELLCNPIVRSLVTGLKFFFFGLIVDVH